MRGEITWERKVTCLNNSTGNIKVHITKRELKQLYRTNRKVLYVNPNRIGIDFDNFNGDSHDFIPNLSIADLVQFINRLHLLKSETVRRAIEEGLIDHGFGIELDSRRKVDFGIEINRNTNQEEIIIEYEDPLREIESFEIGRIDIHNINDLIRALKEVYVEYDYLVKKALLLEVP